MNTQPIRKEEVKRKGEILDFTTGKKKVEGKDIKYRKDGKPKQTKSNSVKGEATTVYPIKDKQDIERIKLYHKDRIIKAKTYHHKMIASRDLCLTIFSFNVGLRMSDIVKLKWGDILHYDNTFKDAVRIQEKKTKKYKDFYLNAASREAITNYITEFKIQIKMNDYIFKSREGGHIKVRSVNAILKKAGKAIGIKYPIGTHSYRKSWSYHQIMAHRDDAYFMAHLMNLMGHSSISATLHYAGISEEQNRQYYNDVNL